MNPSRVDWSLAMAAAYEAGGATGGDVRSITKAFAAALGIQDPYEEPSNAGTASPATTQGDIAP